MDPRTPPPSNPEPDTAADRERDDAFRASDPIPWSHEVK
jgi:hypothetical protein